MSSIIKVDNIQDQAGNNIINESGGTITIGVAGNTVSFASNVSFSSLTIAGNLSVDSGTIKLDGNYPTGTSNVALGNTALDDGSLSGGYNTAIGDGSMTANTSGQTITRQEILDAKQRSNTKKAANINKA